MLEKIPSEQYAYACGVFFACLDLEQKISLFKIPLSFLEFDLL
jgi:hypothetical protein